jgi:hypothetical protein
VLMDFREVSFIDSAGIGILVRLLTRARAALAISSCARFRLTSATSSGPRN